MTRGLPALLAALAAAPLALSACGGAPNSPVSLSACQATAPEKVGTGTLALAAVPEDSSIRALVATSPAPRAGQPYAVRWVVDDRKAGRYILIVAVRQGTNQALRETVAGTVSGRLAEFPSELTFPVAGCWDVDAATGTAAGDVILRVA